MPSAIWLYWAEAKAVSVSMLKSQEVGMAVDRTAWIEVGGTGTSRKAPESSSPEDSELLELDWAIAAVAKRRTARVLYCMMTVFGCL